ncbi:MAG: hypothetical protein V7609_995 [Verrucomicrobiota bacterium]
MKPTRYTDPNILGDVMALIQYLALGRLAIRPEEKLEVQIGKPTSGAATWADLAESHREFFRVRRRDAEHPEDNIRLIWREALPGDLHEGKRPPLSPESVVKLLEIAVSLYDREMTRKQRLAYLIPLGAVIIAGLFSILALLIPLYFRIPPSH